MSSCQKYRDLFDSVFDRELKDSRKRKLFAHLEACADCSLQFKLYDKLIQGMESTEELDAPADFTAMVMQGVRATEPNWQPGLTALPARPMPWLWGGAFAAAAALMIGTFVNWDSRSDPRGNTAPQLANAESPVLGQDRNRDELALNLPKGTARPAPVSPELGITLTHHGGQVEVFDLATSAWRPVRDQEPLNFGDRVRTGNGGIASLEYQREQVALRIKPNSVFQVLDRQTLRVFAGNCWVSVKRKGTVFRTETPNAIASVRGTKYSVEVTPLTEVYRNHGLKSLTDAIAAQKAPRATLDLALYSTNLGLALLKQMADSTLTGHVDTEVKVYESVVEVVAKNSAGGEAASVDVTEGFKSQIRLASISRPKPISENDLLAWKEVMVFDQELVDRARSRAASEAPPATSDTGARPDVAPPTDAGPTSEAGDRPQQFEDLNRR